MPKQCSQTYAATAHDHRYCQLDAGHDGEHIADGFRWSSQPNTPRERLESVKADAQHVHRYAVDADAYGRAMLVSQLASAVVRLCDTLLSTGLLDQTNEGNGETAIEGKSSGETAFVRISQDETYRDEGRPSEPEAAKPPIVPHPAPASVEGVVERRWLPAPNPEYDMPYEAVVPVTFPIGTKVRITRISE